jgi:hypothetical protein
MRCSKSRWPFLGGAFPPTAAFWAVMLVIPPQSSAGSSREVSDTPVIETTAISSPQRSPAIPASEGDIALTDSPFCEFFVIKAASGFALLSWRGGLYVFSEGDLVRGALTVTGLHEIDVAGDPMRVETEAVGVSLRHAQRVYYSRCHPRSGLNAWAR